LGFLANLIAAALLMKADTPFADEFRYVSFTLFVIPMGAGVVVKTMSQWKWMNVCLLCLCGFMVIKRSSVQLQETWRHHGAWLKGNKTLGEALSREGYDQVQVFQKQKNEGETLLHIGHGNFAVHGPDVLHVGSWSKRYPIWKAETREDIIKWCQHHNVEWILFERWRYQSYARGFGGPEYVNNRLSLYYQAVNKTMALITDWEVEGSNWKYALMRIPRQPSSLKPSATLSSPST
jgi:hypothetical protein